MTMVAPDARVYCVLGMHRGGTSVVAQMIGALGAFLGPPERAMRPRADNPDGFGEHQGLTDASDEIFARFGGKWDQPPVFPEHWEQDARLDRLRERMTHVFAEDFRGRALWSWKDPRACLTLPFWQRVVPSMRYVVVVRSPIDVARSLHVRDGLDAKSAVRLWLRHMHGALAHSAGAPRLFVAYDALVSMPAEGAAQLASFVLDGDATPALVERAVSVVRPPSQHHRSEPAAVMADTSVDLGARALFLGLRLLATQQQVAAADASADALTVLAHQACAEPSRFTDGEWRNRIVDLKWVAQRAVDEAESLRRQLAARPANGSAGASR